MISAYAGYVVSACVTLILAGAIQVWVAIDKGESDESAYGAVLLFLGVFGLAVLLMLCLGGHYWMGPQ